VVLLARSKDKLDAPVTEINASSGSSFIGISVDIIDPTAIQSAFKPIKEQFGGAQLAAAI
jgi:short-subunit dehydrogenase